VTTNAFYFLLRDWVLEVLAAVKDHSRPLIVGVSAPQGAGKTTLTKALCALLAERGLKAVAVSVDDFYLGHEAQRKLADRNPTNPYLQQRGYPGTHDIDLGLATLKQLKNIQLHKTVAVPAYDKSAHQGQGDRQPEILWPKVSAPLDVVFLEGWMLGFQAAATNDPALQEINALLGSYQKWQALIDAFIWLEPMDARFVLDWRVEAEERMKAHGRAGMTTAEVKAYIAKFLPAYELYLPAMRTGLPGSGPVLHLKIGRYRLPES